LSNAPADLIFMVMFGVIGYLFKKLDYPLAPMVLAIVLGGRAESSFRQAMIGSQGDLSVFWSNGLVGSITALSMVMLFWPAISAGINRLRQWRGALRPAE
jgi:TctA family transporter